MQMESETHEIHTKREDKTHITTIRIFSWRLQILLHMYSIQLQKITIEFITTRRCPCTFANINTFGTPDTYTIRVPSVRNQLQWLN
jgi:hypothetical protein